MSYLLLTHDSLVHSFINVRLEACCHDRSWLNEITLLSVCLSSRIWPFRNKQRMVSKWWLGSRVSQSAEGGLSHPNGGSEKAPMRRQHLS